MRTSPRLRPLTGREVLKALTSLGFDVVSTLGSEAKLKRVLSTGERQILTISIHQTLDLGTVRAIFRQASRLLQEEELRQLFFSN